MTLAIDASAIVAMAAEEPEAEAFRRILENAGEAWATPVNLFEAGLVLVLRDGRMDIRAYEDWLDQYAIQSSSLVDYQAALRAYLTFGRGVHRAGLNLGDCFAYALAKALDAPLLFKGDDFPMTDIQPAL